MIVYDWLRKVYAKTKNKLTISFLRAHWLVYVERRRVIYFIKIINNKTQRFFEQHAVFLFLSISFWGKSLCFSLPVDGGKIIQNCININIYTKNTQPSLWHTGFPPITLESLSTPVLWYVHFEKYTSLLLKDDYTGIRRETLLFFLNKIIFYIIIKPAQHFFFN